MILFINYISWYGKFTSSISFRCNKHVSSIELHEFSANKRVVKSDQFQFCMRPVTASLRNSGGGAGGVGSWVVWAHKVLARLKNG